jgi:hypothetical protein
MAESVANAEISREISRRNLKWSINNECRSCKRILDGCDGRTGVTPCLGYTKHERGGEARC